VFFGEQVNGSGMQVTSWIGANFPKEPTKVVHHLEGASLVITFSETTEPEIQALLDQITLNGVKETWSRNERSPKQFRLSRTQAIGASFVLRMGDLPPVTVSRMAPLTFMPVSPSGQYQPEMLHIRAREYGNRLLVPIDAKTVTLAFTETMKRSFPTALDGSKSVLPMEWVDDTHLRIDLVDPGYSLRNVTRDEILRIDQLQAVSGNTLDREGSMHIQRTPAVSWKVGGTGADVGGGTRDRYYEQLIFSPDKKQYVGIISLGPSMGDGDGWSYAFVLERGEQPPLIIEELFYSTIEPNNAPIRWINSDTLLYASFYGVYTYETNAMTRRTITDNADDESNNINFAEWDSIRKRLYVVAYEDRDRTDMTKAITFVDMASSHIQRNFTETVLAGKYSMLDLTVTPTDKGVYWTRTEMGAPVTDLVTDQNTVLSAKGVVRLATSDGVYLQRYVADPVDKAERIPIIRPDGWAYWEPGKTEKQIANPPSQGIVFAWGKELMIRIEDERYYRYDPTRDEWVAWQAQGGPSYAEPVKGPDGLYRIISTSEAG
jgi:hypothetical protein